jgi:hypothetical protein
LREQALHDLLIEEDADTALALAGENWTWQKGPEDAALLVQAARAAGRPDAARAVEDWRKQFGGSAI